jgi:hypothetical protein
MAVRPIQEIAAEIMRVWPGADVHSMHHLGLMAQLNTIHDRYKMSENSPKGPSALGILAGFYRHSMGWVGPDSARLRKEIADLIESKTLEGFPHLTDVQAR